MEIQKEDRQLHTIQSYSEHEIRIADKTYTQSILVTRTEIISPLAIQLELEEIKSLDLSETELVIVGFQTPGQLVTFPIREYFALQQIGLEVMNIGAACRTFNVLLAENRQVMGLFFLANKA
jgi:uncharacterized protein